MFSGPPLPLPSTLPIQRLLLQATERGPLGAWFRDTAHTFYLHDTRRGRTGRLIVGPDLGYLITHCTRVALREERELVVLEAEIIIGWRTLQVVTSYPHLPGLAQLSGFFAGLRSSPGELEVPLGQHSPEAVLAELLTLGVPVQGTRLGYSPSAVPPENRPAVVVDAPLYPGLR
jgi:hypothetical protein